MDLVHHPAPVQASAIGAAKFVSSCSCEPVSKLDTLVGEHGARVVQPLPMAVELRLQPVDVHPLHYLDQACFESRFTKWNEKLGKMEDLLEQGKQFVYMIYTFRSVSRAIPMVTDASAGNPAALYKETFELLRPEIQKIKELMVFTESVRKCFCTVVTELVRDDWRARSVPEAVLLALVRLIDLLQRLDNLKDIKASLNNDFSRFKRAWTVIKAEMTDGDEIGDTMIHEIALFLTHPKYPKNQIMQSLRSDIKGMEKNEDVLVDLVDLCLDHLSKERYVLPDEKHVLIRALPHLLWLIDGDSQMKSATGTLKSGEPINVFKHRGIKLQALQDVFKRYPVVPEFADMTLSLGHVLEKAPHFDAPSMERAWGRALDEKVTRAYDLRSQWRAIKDQYDQYLPRFVFVRNSVGSGPLNKTEKEIAEGKMAYQVILEGLRLLERWSSAVQELLAWKSTHPCSLDAAEKLGANRNTPGIEYLCAGKYNYTKDELSVLVDVISMCKSLADTMSQAESKLGPLIRLYLHNRVQTIIQADLVPVLHRVNKHNKTLCEMLLHVRDLAADWKGGVEPADDYKKYRRAHGPVMADPPLRFVSLTMTQLQLVRSSIRALTNTAVVGQGGGCLGGKRDLGPEELPRFVELYDETAFVPYVLDYRATIHQTTDFSGLWFREFYLELTRQIQFPIEMSLPWILTEHVLQHETVAVPLLEKALYMLDVYNDAAHRALYVLNKQFLYDEIEAEMNLVFDQFTFMVSDDVYGYYKDSAASVVLDKAYKRRLDARRGGNWLQQPWRRFHVPTEQRHIGLLGRYADLNRIIAQNVTNKMTADLDSALRRFESQDATSVLDLDLALLVLRKTHELLAEHLNLCDFDQLLLDVDQAGTKSRLALHTLDSIVNDLLPNFCYNAHTQRFIRSAFQGRKVSFNAAPKGNISSSLYGHLCYKAFEHQTRLLRGFFGQEHLLALVRLLGHSLPVVVEEMVTYLQERVLYMRSYASAIQPGIQPCKLPKFIFKSSGAYAAFETLLKPLLEYQDLKSEVFQLFREIGNCLALFKDLSQCTDVTEILGSVQVAPYVGVQAVGGSSYEQAPSAESPLIRLVVQVEELIGRMPRVATTEPKVPEIARVLSVESNKWQQSCAGNGLPRSLFHQVLRRLEAFIASQGMRADWLGTEPENGVLEVEGSKEFYRLWSALSFLFSAETSRTENSGDPTDEDLFGHGFTIAGTTLVYLLGQRERFNLLDFSWHVLNVLEYESSLSLGSDVNNVGTVDKGLQTAAKDFVSRASRHKLLARKVFANLDGLHQVEPPTDQLLFKPPRNIL